MNLEKLKEIEEFLGGLATELDEESARLQEIKWEWKKKQEAVSKIWDKITMAKNYIWEAQRDWKAHTSEES